MKVLIVRPFPSIIDLKNNSYNQQEVGLATAFLSMGHEAGIVYFGGDRHEDEVYATAWGTIKIYYRKAKVYLNRISVFEDLTDLKDSYDLIVSNEYDQVETVKTLRGYRDKTVIYHGPYYAPFNKRYNTYNRLFDMLFAKWMQRKKPVILTKSMLAKEFLEQKGFSVKEDVGVGLDMTQLQNGTDGDNPMKGRLRDENINLLYVGKLEPRRNTLFLLDVLQELVKKDSRYRLVIVGTGEKEYVQQVFDTIKEKALEDYVIYEPRMMQKHLPYLYDACDMFLLPTSYEIWGMVLMEAMKFNCPVLTTYNGGSSSLIQSGKNGWILDLDVDAWVNAIAESPLDIQTLIQSNEKLLADKCQWQSIAEKMLAYHESER